MLISYTNKLRLDHIYHQLPQSDSSWTKPILRTSCFLLPSLKLSPQTYSAIKWSNGSLLWVRLVKKTDSPPPSCHQLPISPYLEVESGESLSSPHGVVFTALLCSSLCANNHSSWEICVQCLSYSKDIISQFFSTSVPYNSSFPSSEISSSFGGGGGGEVLYRYLMSSLNYDEI